MKNLKLNGKAVKAANEDFRFIQPIWPLEGFPKGNPPPLLIWRQGKLDDINRLADLNRSLSLQEKSDVMTLPARYYLAADPT